MSPVWRQGHQVPRNIYKDDEPVAMLATEELAAEIVAGMNAVPFDGDHIPETMPAVKMDTPEGLWRARCSCGWVQIGVGSKKHARQAGQQHADARNEAR